MFERAVKKSGRIGAAERGQTMKKSGILWAQYAAPTRRAIHR
jgi:hypothetical protein